MNWHDMSMFVQFLWSGNIKKVEFLKQNLNLTSNVDNNSSLQEVLNILGSKQAWNAVSAKCWKSEPLPSVLL